MTTKSPIADPDAGLVQRVAQGDQQAASLLMQRHLQKVLGLARSMLGDAHQAEDVAQEVFLKVWTHAASWQAGKARFATWIHRVTVNQCYDLLRKKGEVLMDMLPEREDEDYQGAEDIMMHKERAQTVEAALAHLAPRQRTAIALCHLQEMGNIEAAEVMGISVEALESLLSRGRRKLKQVLMPRRDDLLGKG